MKIAVAYNDDVHLKTHLNEVEKLGEAEVIDTAREIAELLDAQLVAVKDDVGGALLELRNYDVVVNLCEGVLGHPDWEMNFALGLEMFGIKHTACEPIALGICTDKKLVKRILLASGVRTPKFWHGEEGGTWIVKPSREDAGIGIDAASVVSSTSEIEARAKYVEETYGQPALVEEFIDGRELNQALYFSTTGPIVLPPGEIVFDDDLASDERVVGWKAKWANGSREDRGTRNRTPALIDDKTRDELKTICLRAASTLRLSGYVRFDLRQSQSGRLFIVDINPNPDIGRGSGFRKALDAAGIAFADFLKTLIMAAAASPSPMKIRPAEARDRERIQEILVATAHFTEEEVRCAMELVDQAHDDPAKGDYFVHVLEEPEGGPVQGYVCHGPTPLTDGVFDLYWIAVDPKRQGQGIGQLLLRFVENEVRRKRGRMLLIETSSKESYASTMRFYERSGYDEISRIKDFYRIEDDKVVYCKKLK